MQADHHLRALLRAFCIGALAICAASARAEAADDETNPAATDHDQDVAEIVKQVQPSVVVVTFSGRDGRTQGIGSGFIVREDGLIATNLHVIGEARPISVRLLDGRTFDVVSVFAHERSVDLALLKINAEGLPALELGDSDQLAQGQSVVAFGNPEGLEHSVVAGIVSGLREDVDGVPMVQLAMPIERGNSGGPVVDFDGRVQGLTTLKSLVTENLGYAVAVNALKPLLERPNPVPIENWLTIGVLNPRYWDVPDDRIRWTQRAGRIRAMGLGAGFGGRSLCLSTKETPEVPFEVAVTVKMDESDGAAGLAFHVNGETHYGFYPSSGQMRFSRFDGPTVYQWNVLRQEPSPHYREGEWNRLKVRVEESGFICYCNDEVVFEVKDAVYDSGRVGLVKFRHTSAEFKQFQVGEDLSATQLTDAEREALLVVLDGVEAVRPPTSTTVDGLSTFGPATQDAIEEQARELEQRAVRLRQLARAVHERHVRTELLEVLGAETDVDLLRAALLIAALDNEELDVDFYVSVADDLAREFRDSLPEEQTDAEKLAAFHTFLFEQHGFHGSRTNYYHASNSYLNEVLDDREGLPIALSVLYIELARRAGLKAVGIGLPGHFVAQFVPAEGEPQLVDVFDGGRTMTHAEAMAQVTGRGMTWDDEYLRPQEPREIITRMLRNLINVANSGEDPEAGLRYIEVVLALQPDSVQDRLFKALLCYHTGRAAEGLEQVAWLLERQPEGLVIEPVEELQEALRQLQAANEARR